MLPQDAIENGFQLPGLEGTQPLRYQSPRPIQDDSIREGPGPISELPHDVERAHVPYKERIRYRVLRRKIA
jgi:hypothetical protein